MAFDLVLSVMLDPGHGGPDSGRVEGAVAEKDIVLDTGLMLARELRDRGHIVHMTRDDDDFIGINQRAAKANALGVDCFLSLHCNGSSNPEAKGPQTIHYHKSTVSPTLAEPVQQALEGVMGTSNWSGVLPDGSVHTGYRSEVQRYVDSLPLDASWKEKDRLARMRFGDRTYRTLGVLRETNMPAVLLELGFLSNLDDRAMLSAGGILAAIASAVADAIEEWGRTQREMAA